MARLKRIKFKYKDSYTHGEWREQECVMESVADCIKFYGLGVDCEYQIISVEDE